VFVSAVSLLLSLPEVWLGTYLHLKKKDLKNAEENYPNEVQKKKTFFQFEEYINIILEKKKIGTLVSPFVT
jgi:hypothetical protein